MNLKISANILISIILLILNIALSHLFYSEGNEFILSTVLVTIDTFIISVLLLKKQQNKTIYLIMMISFVLKVLLMYFELYGRNILILPNSGRDTEHFFYVAFSKNIDQLYGYYQTIRYLGILFCKQRIMLQFANIIFSLLSEIIVLKTLNKLKISPKAKILSMGMLCFLISNMIISVELLRESLMILLNTLSLYFFINWFVEGKKNKFILAVLFILLSSYYHSSMILCLIPYFFYLAFYNHKIKKIVFAKNTIYMFILSMGLVYIVYRFAFPYVDRYFNNLDSIDAINKKMSYYVRGGSTYLPSLAHQDSIFMLIMTSPLKLLYFYFSPMIWDFRGLNDILTFIASSLFYIYLFIRYFKEKKKGPLEISLFVIIISFGLIYGLSCFSAGSAMRHREKIVSFFIILYALIFDKNNNKINDGGDFDEKSN